MIQMTVDLSETIGANFMFFHNFLFMSFSPIVYNLGKAFLCVVVLMVKYELSAKGVCVGK